jgi:hypothetical protein
MRVAYHAVVTAQLASDGPQTVHADTIGAAWLAVAGRILALGVRDPQGTARSAHYRPPQGWRTAGKGKPGQRHGRSRRPRPHRRMFLVSQEQRGWVVRRNETTRPLAAALSSQGSTGHCFHAVRPL